MIVNQLYGYPVSGLGDAVTGAVSASPQSIGQTIFKVVALPGQALGLINENLSYESNLTGLVASAVVWIVLGSLLFRSRR